MKRLIPLSILSVTFLSNGAQAQTSCQQVAVATAWQAFSRHYVTDGCKLAPQKGYNRVSGCANGWEVVFACQFPSTGTFYQKIWLQQDPASCTFTRIVTDNALLGTTARSHEQLCDRHDLDATYPRFTPIVPLQEYIQADELESRMK